MADDVQNLTPKKRWPLWAKGFLAALAKLGVVGYAVEKAKISRTSAYNLRESDDEFRAAWEVSLDQASDRLEKEALRRGHDGVKKPVFQGKELVGYIREYSDTLLIFMLKGNRPDKFRERYDVTGKMAHNVSGKVAFSVEEAVKADKELEAWEHDREHAHERNGKPTANGSA